MSHAHCDAIRRIQLEYVKLVEEHIPPPARLFAQAADGDIEQLRGYLSTSTIRVPYGGRQVTSLQFHLLQLLPDVDTFWQRNAGELRSALAGAGILAIASWPESGKGTSPYLAYFDSICVLDSLHIAAKAIDTRPEDEELVLVSALKWIGDLETWKLAVAASVDIPLMIFHPMNTPNEDEHLLVAQLDQITSWYLQSEVLGRRDFTNDLDEVFGSLPKGPIEIQDADRRGRMLSLLSGARASLTRLGEDSLLDRWADETNTGSDVADTMIGHLQEGAIIGKDLLAVFALFRSQMLATINFEREALVMNAEPSIEGGRWETTLLRYKWLAEQYALSANVGEQQLVAQALSREFQWIDLSIEDAVRFRELGWLQDVRDLFRTGRHAMKSATADGFHSAAVELARTVDQAIDCYEEEVANERWGRLKHLGLKAAELGGSAVLGFASFFVPAPAELAVGAAVSSLVVGGGSLLELVNEHLRGKRRHAQLLSRPIGFLAERRRLNRLG